MKNTQIQQNDRIMNGASNPEEASDTDKFKAIKGLLDNKTIPDLKKIYKMPYEWNQYTDHTTSQAFKKSNSSNSETKLDGIRNSLDSIRNSLDSIKNVFFHTLSHEKINLLKGDNFRLESIDDHPGELTERMLTELSKCCQPAPTMKHVSNERWELTTVKADIRIQAENLYWMFGFIVYQVCEYGHDKVDFNFTKNAIYNCIKEHESNNIPTPSGDSKQKNNDSTSDKTTDSMSLMLVFSASHQETIKAIQKPLSNAYTEFMRNYEWIRYAPTSDNPRLFSHDSSGDMYWLKIDLKQAALPKSINNRLDCTDLLESLIKKPGWVTAVQSGGPFDLGTSGLNKKGFTKA